jgi:hypothetical protein
LRHSRQSAGSRACRPLALSSAANSAGSSSNCAAAIDVFN